MHYRPDLRNQSKVRRLAGWGVSGAVSVVMSVYEHERLGASSLESRISFEHRTPQRSFTEIYIPLANENYS